jgi:hypothetical protein
MTITMPAFFEKYPIQLFLFALITILFFSAFIPFCRQNSEIILHDERSNFTPKDFYIANIIDDRDNRRAIAWLLPFGNTEAQTQTYPVDFQGGFAAVKRFIENSMPQNTALQPIMVHVKKFRVTEFAAPNGLTAGKAELAISFDLQQGDEIQHLVDYAGNADYTRTPGPAQDIEPTLRKMLQGGLSYFNTWISKQAGSDVRLAKSVKVSFSDYSEKSEGDTVYYSVSRPLTWDDFKGGIPNSRYAAEVSPTIGYSEQTDIKDGIIRLHLEIKVCLPKSACWAKEGVRGDAYTLNHEQRHFDLAKIAAAHFVQKIKSEDLAVNNYDGPINVDYLDAYRQMDTLEKKYDKETTHGLDHLAQDTWNERIDRELKQLGVK